ncbi:MAG: hypothetical protein NTZ78_13815 [Candidatus Aureabacteria bacterium]|nr:hypothetical protein [Candidatus Auribacterota bacterium]
MTCIIFAVAFFTASFASATPITTPLSRCDKPAFFPDLERITAIQRPSVSKPATGRIIEGHNLIWGENIGWVNIRTKNADLKIGSNILAGWVWLENCGWICLGAGHPLDGKRYSNRNSFDWGVNNDDKGNLSGYAWSDVTGWISFQTGHSCVYLDKAGQFYGHAWGENVGWMHFGPGGSVQYLAKADPGPWKEIEQESRGKLARGPDDSEISCGSVPVTCLNNNYERHDRDADSICMFTRGGNDSRTHIRCSHTPVYIRSLDKLTLIRAPPVTV